MAAKKSGKPDHSGADLFRVKIQRSADPSAHPVWQKAGQVCKAGSLILYFFIFLVYMELMLKLLSGDGASDMLYPILLAVPVALLFSVLCGFFKRRINYTIAMVLTGLITVLFMTQYIYRFIFKTYLQLYSVAVGTQQAMGFSGAAFSAIGDNLLQLLVLAFPVLFLAVFGRRLLFLERRTWLWQGVTGGGLVVSFLLTLVVLACGDRSLYSPYDLYYNTAAIDMSVHKLGLLTSTRLDLGRLLFGYDSNHLDLTQESSFASVSSSASSSASSQIIISADPSGPESEPEQPQIDTSPNALDIDFDQLIAEAPNDVVKTLHEYFSTVTPTNKNEYTGMFEGYNLIMLTAEGFSHMAVDKELTPTLYKLTHEGFVFEDFYTPIWGVSTSDGEYVACTSLIPKSGVWSFYRSGLQGNDMQFCLGNQFKALGYNTYAYHDHTYDYYGRNYSHPNMGYTYKGVGNGLDMVQTWPESDLEMMQKTVDEWIGDEHFHAYYMTVSGHLYYTFEGNAMATKNREYVQDLALSEEAKAYIACNMELDKALEYLLDRLEEAGKLDNTVIVLSADHYPYGLAKETMDELTGHVVEENFELYKNACIIWSGSMKEPVVIDRPSCSMDILPTVSNLFGLAYDSRLLMGTDMLSDTDPLIVFADTSFIKGGCRFNANTGEIVSTDGMTYDQAYVDSLRGVVNNKFKISTAILDNDYYQYIE